MKCPHCHSLETKVLDTRSQKGGDLTRRRRECEQCQTRFATIETLVRTFPMVVKKDGRREPFCPDKLLGGIKAACQKRPISASRVEQLMESVSKWLADQNEKEVSTVFIGRKVMEELRPIDEVAYVRFASVYKTFKDVSEFVADLKPHVQTEKEAPL